MDAAVQIIIGGLLQGSVFAVVALGFSLVFRMTGVINLSQGAFCVLGACIAYALRSCIGLPICVAVPVAVLVTAAVFGLADRRRAPSCRRSSRLPQQQHADADRGAPDLHRRRQLVHWGGDPYTLPPFSGEAPVRLLGVRVPTQGFWIAGIASIIIVGFWYCFARTTLGKALQACAENPTAARLMGIDVAAHGAAELRSRRA